MKRYAALLSMLAVLVPMAAFAGANEGVAALVETGASTKTTACTTLIRQDCAAINNVSQTLVGPNNYAALYAGRMTAPLTITGADFGIAYSNAILVTSWNKCGDLDLPTATWPASGSGNSEIWATAQTGNVILLGWFKVTTYAGYGPMTFGLAPHPQNPARVLDPMSNFDDFTNQTAIGSWDGTPGTQGNCYPVAVRNTTWGNIKNMYQN